MRGLPDSHPDKYIETIISKMQNNSHFNCKHSDYVYMYVPVYAKHLLRELLQVSRLVEPIKIKNVKQAQQWRDLVFGSLILYRELSGGAKCRNIRQSSDKPVIYSKDIRHEKTSNWFKGNFLYSFYLAYETRLLTLLSQQS